MKKTIKLFKPQQIQPLDQEQKNSIITHRLKPKRREEEETRSISNADKSAASTNQLLSSISTKLNPRSISVSSESRWSQFKTEKNQIKISCLDHLSIPRFNLGNQFPTLNFEELKRKAIRKKIKNIVLVTSCVSNSKKLCSEANCTIKQKWKNKLIIQPRDITQTQKLKTMVLNAKQISKIDQQIEKDIGRSFPDKIIPKPKLTLYHPSLSQKTSITESLKWVLKMLSVSDPDVGYVQGMNLYAGVITSHIKQVELSYLFVKEVMKYGNMRKMYTNNFNDIKEVCQRLLHRHIKILMYDLYQVFTKAGVTIEIFIPFYISMFSCVADYNVMHSIIDEFMTKGFSFFDKLILSMLCYLKQQYFNIELAEIVYKLGSSFIRSKQLPWHQVINLTQAFQLN